MQCELEQAWWAAVDSNHLPPRYQHGALPVELAARHPTRPENQAQTNGVYPGRRFYGDV